MTTKSFQVADILSCATGILCGKVDGIYAVLEYMTGGSLFTHQLPRAQKAMEPEIKKQLPWLESGEFKAKFAEFNAMSGEQRKEQYSNFVESIADVFGATHALTPTIGYHHMDPISELAMMRKK